jgi:hypothetical protein
MRLSCPQIAPASPPIIGVAALHRKVQGIFPSAKAMSALGYKRTFRSAIVMSALPRTSVPLTINLEMGPEYRRLTGDSLENVKDGCGANLSGRGQ